MTNGFVFQPGTRFLDPDKILFQTGLASGQIVADLGAGSGFFAIASSKIVGSNGQVFVADIMEHALNNVAAEARMQSLRNIRTIHCDLEATDACTQVPTGAVDLVIFANVLHQIKNKQKLLTDAYRLLKTGGKILVVEWNTSPSPIGPMASDRVAESTINDLATKANLKPAGVIKTDPYHYGLIFIK